MVRLTRRDRRGQLLTEEYRHCEYHEPDGHFACDQRGDLAERPSKLRALAFGGGVAARTFTFTSAGSCGGSIVANLRLQDGTANLGTIGVAFNMGSLSVVTQNFSNSGLITIQDNTSALPYPSTISVSGLTGTITKVTATLSNINHTFPDDVDVLLVGRAAKRCS
jgi:hypothetical protein